MPEAARHTDKGKDGNLQKTNLFRASIHACVEVSYGYRVYLTSFYTSRCAIIELWTGMPHNYSSQFVQDHKEGCNNNANAMDASIKPTCYSCNIDEEEMTTYVRGFPY